MNAKKLLAGLTLLMFCTLAGAVASSGTVLAATAWQNQFWNGFCSQGRYGSGCKGYFTGIKPGCIASGICDLDRVSSNGMNVNNGNDFVAAIQNALNGGSTQNRCGAAFVIENMLGHSPFNSNCNAGVNTAKSNFGTWQTLVLSYANSTNPNYGVHWDTITNPNVNSSWFPSITDDVFSENVYHCTRTAGCPGTYNSYGTECANALADAAHGCGGKYRNDETTGWVWRTVNVGIPVIQFYFPGGTFEIERGCSNLVGNLQPLPKANQPPTGSITVACDVALAQQVATVRLDDPDGATTGYIVAGSWTSGNVSSPGPAAITIPQSATSPYTPQQIKLYVRDVGPGTAVQVATANTQVPCAGLTCGTLSVTPARLDPYMNFSATVTVKNTVDQPPSPATMDLAISPPIGATYSTNRTNNPVTGSGSVSTSIFNNLGPTNKAGVYAARWTLHPPSGATTVCNGTFTVTYLPYLQVYGGDVMSGASPTTAGGAGTCAANANAGIFSWNNHATDFSGGGAQYAVQALAAIEDFAGAQNAAPPTSLSFANIFTPPDAGKLDTGQGLFGGYFGGTTGDCDFTSDITSAPATADATIGTTTVSSGARTVRYITGADVYIDGNIVYASTGGWAKVSDIPYFKLVVVGGNIYIKNTVTQLDGLYVAEPDSAGGGNIYTCASALGAPVSPTANGYFNTCNHQLVVNGSFVAKQVQFLRTYGSLGQAKASDSVASNHSAEVFNYTPELWLPRGGSVAGSGYAAITSLPPVL